MRLLHLADLHIGKKMLEYSMVEEQKHILNEIIHIVEEKNIDVVLIAGDIYDKNVPLEKGVAIFDEFLTSLHNMATPVCIISGNHDSGERVEFASKLLTNSGVHIAGVYRGSMEKVTFTDEYGKVCVYMLPFVKPSMVRPYFPEVDSYDKAVKMIMEKEDIDYSTRNVILSHQFVTSATSKTDTCDSETVAVGGLDNVDVEIYKDFDYVALGHIHGPQRVGYDHVRYAGSPLKYSFSEVNHKKSVTVIELGNKGEFSYELIPLVPLHEVREIKGPIDKILDIENYSRGNVEDLIRVILTDEEELYSPLIKIKQVYSNVLRLDFENSRTRLQGMDVLRADNVEQKSVLDLFREFYEKQNNVPLNEEQEEIIKSLVWEE